MTEDQGKSIRRSHRRSYFGPILLIAIGLVFLAKNIGLIPGEGWDTIWRLWPILLVVAGVDDLFRGEGIAWPLLMIGAGIFLLYNYFGPQNQISWTQLLTLWPILLIALGIDVLFRGHSSWMTVVGVVLAVLLLGGAVLLTGGRVEVAARYDRISEALPLEADSMNMDLSLDVGELLIGTDTADDLLLSGAITPGDIQDDLELSGKQAQYELKNIRPAFFPYTARWEIDLTPNLPAELMINNGVGELVLEFAGMELDSLVANQGVGRMVVNLPGSSTDAILIKQGVGAILVQVPPQVRIAVDANSGLSRVDFPSGFELEDGYYVTAGATRSNADLVITVEQGIGLIDFEFSR
jgi:hypothetical protein